MAGEAGRRVTGVLALVLWIAEYLFLPLGAMGWVLWWVHSHGRSYWRDHLLAGVLSGAASAFQIYALALAVVASQAGLSLKSAGFWPPLALGYGLGLVAAWLFARALPEITGARWTFFGWMLGAALFPLGGVVLLLVIRGFLLWRILRPPGDESERTPLAPYGRTSG